ncbi:TNF receptor-associated factor 2 [Erpetoichthys calabaricus]|uniref:TNF receptor-associated factor 2 n=1 Tax=Erpetoichthys calabaricus TaxID=27687 RepID=UPI00223465E2|nr:TNF receptor-associated factor 2 [Erpetoichthys calabaricus]
MARSSSLPSSLDSTLPGFSLTILGAELEQKYLCRQCKLILRRPYQAGCGHRFCAFCFKQIISSGPQHCLACADEGVVEDLLDTNSAFPDNAARREIENLPAVCSNPGCVWKGSIREYEASHEGQCEFQRIECDACKQMIRSCDKERHMERECPERSLNCRYCKTIFNFKDIKAHDEICLKYPMHCEGCGKKKIPREKFYDHAKSCGKYKSPCHFKGVGCPVIVENEKLAEHEIQGNREHMRLLLAAVESLKFLNEEKMVSNLLAPRSKPRGLDFCVQNLDECLIGGSLYCDPDEGFASNILPSVDKQYHRHQTRYDDLAQKLATFENIVCVLNREVEKNSLTLEAYSRQRGLDQEKIDYLTSKVRQMERSVSLKDLAIAEMEQKLQEHEHSTHDGVFIWKINDFSRKRQEAVAGRMPAIFSPVFYTSKYGYRMCLRLYLNGDGTGRGTHLSLFFVVMKGKWDALLKWPFNQKVTLMLLDQNNREHIIDAFRPDITSSSFQRPNSEMNIASGCPLFCPLHKLDCKSASAYLQEDTIFIKAIVDLTGL